jgi:hypothetical protein
MIQLLRDSVLRRAAAVVRGSSWRYINVATNDPANLVPEAMRGLSATFFSLFRIPCNNYIHSVLDMDYGHEDRNILAEL